MGPLDHPGLELRMRLRELQLRMPTRREIARDFRVTKTILFAKASRDAAAVEAAAVFSQVPALVHGPADLTRGPEFLLGYVVRPILGREEERAVLADRFFSGVAEHPLRTRVPR